MCTTRVGPRVSARVPKGRRTGRCRKPTLVGGFPSSARGQFKLGEMYEKGDSVVERSSTEAARWYKKAAKQGDADAQIALDAMREKGHGEGRVAE
jgi:TPR repeat protein